MEKSCVLPSHLRLGWNNLERKSGARSGVLVEARGFGPAEHGRLVTRGFSSQREQPSPLPPLLLEVTPIVLTRPPRRAQP